MKTVICEQEAVCQKAALHIKKTLDRVPNAVIAFAGGKTMGSLWQQLAELCRVGELSFQRSRILAAASLIGTDDIAYMEKEFIRKTDIPLENFFYPDSSAPGKYDELIASLGGIDLAVLGIGENAHIAYNEPGTLFDTRTRVQLLTDRTKRQLKARGYTDEAMPDEAVTMGIKTITDAKDIIVLAEGESKSAAVFQMLYAKTTSYIPASFLQIPLNVTVYIDTAAASQL